MRSVILVFCIFAALLILIGINRAYVLDTADMLLTYASSLQSPDLSGSAEAVEKFINEWNTRKDLLKFSIRLDMIDSIDEGLATLKLYAEQGDTTAFSVKLCTLQKKLSELGRFERFHLFSA